MLRPSEVVILAGPRLRDADDRTAGLLDAERGLLARGRKGAFRFGAPLVLAVDGVALDGVRLGGVALDGVALDGVRLGPFASMGLAGAIFLAGGREGEDLEGEERGSLDAAVLVAAAPDWVNLRRGRVVENHNRTWYEHTRYLVPDTTVNITPSPQQ